jgi:GT2 family glycosyltransferase
MTMRSVSIVIVNYCTCDLLRDCLHSLEREGTAAVEIIVVDNHSTDGSAEMLSAEFPRVRLLQNSDNRGFSAANNLGIAQAHANYILLLNSDTIVPPGTLTAMAEFMDQTPECGAAGCRLLWPDGRSQISSGGQSSLGIARLIIRLSGVSRLLPGDAVRRFLRRYLGFALGRTLRACLEPYAGDDQPREVDLLSAACLLLRRDAIDQVGLLDERFFMYLEDLDYSLRFRKAGWKLYYLPAENIIHLVGQSSAGRMRQYSQHAYDSLFYFYSKHRSPRTLWMVRGLVGLAFCCRWAAAAGRSAVWRRPMDRRNRSDIAKIIQLCWRWNSSPQDPPAQPPPAVFRTEQTN